MSENSCVTSPHFVGLIYSLANAAQISLGQVPNPVTGRRERDLGHAEETIDLLDALREKTRGNLTREESSLLDSSITTLRLAFVSRAQGREP
ncbi:MAG: DUF1844 domain-containing protein [Candidatus Schekmanbacteria bacterium]|nr:DUF1844 domain-containing protein [Candidatus Schekmanbacteria bacterium]